jgi:hypothetical protein
MSRARRNDDADHPRDLGSQRPVPAGAPALPGGPRDTRRQPQSDAHHLMGAGFSRHPRRDSEGLQARHPAQGPRRLGRVAPRPQRGSSARQSAKPKRDPRDETIALAMAQATSSAGRERTRAYIKECGSPVVAAQGVFFAYAEAADKTDPRYAVACRAGCWFCCTIPVAVTTFEAAMVRSVVVTLPEEEQQAIWGRLQEHIAVQNQALADSNGQRISFRHRCPLDGKCGCDGAGMNGDGGEDERETAHPMIRKMIPQQGSGWTKGMTTAADVKAAIGLQLGNFG